MRSFLRKESVAKSKGQGFENIYRESGGGVGFLLRKMKFAIRLLESNERRRKKKICGPTIFQLSSAVEACGFYLFFLNFPKTNLLFKRWKIIISELQTKNFVKREKTWIGVLEIVRIVLGTIELIDYDIIGIEFQCLSTWQASYLLDFGSKPLVKRR